MGTDRDLGALDLDTPERPSLWLLGLGSVAALGAAWTFLSRAHQHDLARRVAPNEPTEPPVVARSVLPVGDDVTGVRDWVTWAPPSLGSAPAPVPQVTPPPAPAPARIRERVRNHPLAGDLPWFLAVVAVVGLALALRLLHHSTNYDVFIDEITYSRIGQSVALGHGVTLYGGPFFLHPPLFFY